MFKFSHLVLSLLNMSATQTLIKQLQQGDEKALARCITIVENELDGYEEILTTLKFNSNIPPSFWAELAAIALIGMIKLLKRSSVSSVFSR